MTGILLSIGCLFFVWGVPMLLIGLLVNMIADVRQERARRREEEKRRKTSDQDSWPPPPESPKAKP